MEHQESLWASRWRSFHRWTLVWCLGYGRSWFIYWVSFSRSYLCPSCHMEVLNISVQCVIGAIRYNCNQTQSRSMLIMQSIGQKERNNCALISVEKRIRMELDWFPSTCPGRKMYLIIVQPPQVFMSFLLVLGYWIDYLEDNPFCSSKRIYSPSLVTCSWHQSGIVLATRSSDSTRFQRLTSSFMATRCRSGDSSMKGST